MAQPKVESQSLWDWIKEDRERFRATHKFIKQRFYMVEVTPAYTESGYYGQWVPEERNRVSPYYDTQEEAEAWTEGWTPEQGRYFVIESETLREHVERQWWPS